jgi:membrane associated rhomboid family serine protease
MFQNVTADLSQLISLMQANTVLALKIIALLWAIQFVNALLGYRLTMFGIYPRHPFGLLGIFTSPFIHGSFNHLFFNTIPLFLLLILLLGKGFHTFIVITLNIMILGGLGTWLFGRRALHVGASSVIMGYMGYLLAQAYTQRSASAIILGILALYYCGSILLSLIPNDAKTSFEGHIFGFMAGVACGLGYMVS